MITQMQKLINCFKAAQEQNIRYIAVKVSMKNFDQPEVIINSKDNFDKKLAYYQMAYNEDLTLKANPDIKIIDFVYGDSFADIEKVLM